jgi:hypothetical protein
LAPAAQALTAMDVHWLVAVAFGTAVAAQLLLVGWLVRIYATIPPKIPYGTAGKVYFWYGPRAVVWSAPIAFLLILAVAGGATLSAPPVRAQPLMAIPFFLLAGATPLVALSITDKINAARNRGR